MIWVKVFFVCMCISLVLSFSIAQSSEPEKDSKPTRKEYIDSANINAMLQRQIIKSLKKTMNDKLDSLALNPPVRIVKKYVKVYRVVPIFVPVNDSLAYVTRMADTLSDIHFDTPHKRKGIFNKILHL